MEHTHQGFSNQHSSRSLWTIVDKILAPAGMAFSCRRAPLPQRRRRIAKKKLGALVAAAVEEPVEADRRQTTPWQLQGKRRMVVRKTALVRVVRTLALARMLFLGPSSADRTALGLEALPLTGPELGPGGHSLVLGFVSSWSRP